MRLRYALWLVLLGSAGSGCAARAQAGPAAAAGPNAAPAVVAADAGPPLSEAECSRLFTHMFALLQPDPAVAAGSSEFRLLFVEQCPSGFERVRHFDCGMAASTRDQVLACEFPPVEPGRELARGDLPALECKRESPFGPVTVDARQFRARHGAGADKYSELATSLARPLEACGVGAGHFALGLMTCDDGSRPFRTLAQVEQARRGSVGEGGRCGTMIDAYRVACPEKTYELFVDVYFCLPDAWPVR